VSKRTDLHYGRRGGRFLPDGYTPAPLQAAPECEVCGLGMVLGQERRHRVCSPTLPCCPTVHVDLVDLEQHRKQHEKADAFA
jgi:hypothetical protein